MVGEFIFKFKLTKAKNDVSRVELLEFMKTLEHECENKLSMEFNHDNFVYASISHISWNFDKKNP